MKIIKSITDAPTKKDDNDQDVLIPLSIGIELENRLDNDTAVDLQFKIGFKEYSEMFNRVFGCSSEEEKTEILNLLTLIAGYEDEEQKYIITQCINNKIYIKNMDTDEETYVGMDTRLLTYFVSIVNWIHGQDQYLSYTEV